MSKADDKYILEQSLIIAVKSLVGTRKRGASNYINDYFNHIIAQTNYINYKPYIDTLEKLNEPNNYIFTGKFQNGSFFTILEPIKLVQYHAYFKSNGRNPPDSLMIKDYDKDLFNQAKSICDRLEHQIKTLRLLQNALNRACIAYVPYLKKEYATEDRLTAKDVQLLTADFISSLFEPFSVDIKRYFNMPNTQFTEDSPFCKRFKKQHAHLLLDLREHSLETILTR